MNRVQPQVTEAMLSVTRREAAHRRIARIALPLFGVLMVAACVIGLQFGSLSPFRLFLLCLSGLFYLLSYSSLIRLQWSVGMIPQAGIGAYFFVLAALWNIMTSRTVPTAVLVPLWIVMAAAGLVVIFLLVLLAVMLFGSLPPMSRGSYTVIVLGCKLKNGRPGRMLRRRLNRAVSELNRHPDVMCIVSGGRAPDQPCAEADAMFEYLTAAGIDGSRILVEPLSSTTYENFLFSSELLSERNLPRRLGVVSDRFHQFRAGRIARTAGIDSFPISCCTAWYVAIQFWMRDALCIVERLIKGHW